MNCSTVYIDEYRYEVGIVFSDVKQWYRVVSSLRAIGQLYYYLRVVMLFVFTLKAFDGDATTAHSERPLWTRVRKAVVLICKMPMQSVIFGSPFPIFCYALAHAIDSAISYEILGKTFNTQGGIFQLKFADMLTVGFNQMRSVWVLAAFVHVCVIVSTSRKKLIWSPISGVLGVPEFLFSGISSLTIVAQYRSTRFRNTSIRKVFEVVDSPTVAFAKYRQDTQYRGSGNMQLGGAWIDFKFFVCTLSVLVAVVVVRRCFVYCSRARQRDAAADRTNDLQTRTPVPYSAGVLWPIGAMVMHWTSDYFCVKPQADKNDQVVIIRRITRMAELSKGQVAPTLANLSSSRWQSMGALNALSDNFPSVVMSSSEFHSIQLQMETLHDRGDDVEATIAFMNLVNMSDPLVYLCYITGGGGGVQLGYFQSRIRRERFFLLPLGTDERYFSAHTRDLKLVYKVRSSSLNVCELIHCG